MDQFKSTKKGSINSINIITPGENSTYKLFGKAESSTFDSSSSTNKSTSSESFIGINYIDSIPPEIIIRIFKMLTYTDLYKRVSLVSKKWHNLSRDPTLLHLLHISKKTPLEKTYDYLEARPLLQVLKMNDYEFVNETIEHALVTCPNIYCLDIGFCEINPTLVLSLCLYGNNIKHLNLEGVDMDHEKMELIFSYLPNIEKINLSHCTSLTDQTIYSMSTRLNKIIFINIDGIQNISDYGIVSLSENHNLYLTKIWLDGCDLSNIALQALTVCLNLELLSISYADTLTDDSVYPLREMANLQSLTIHKATQLTKSAMLELFSLDESKLSNLTYLDLNECSVIDDEVFSALLQICGINLTVLSLHWCWNITDNGIQQMVDICGKMSRLSLIGNHVIKGTAFEQIPNIWLDLKLLNLTNCNQIDDELMADVANRMPHVFIFDYFGERFGDINSEISQYDIARYYEKFPICGD